MQGQKALSMQKGRALDVTVRCDSALDLRLKVGQVKMYVGMEIRMKRYVSPAGSRLKNQAPRSFGAKPIDVSRK